MYESTWRAGVKLTVNCNEKMSTTDAVYAFLAVFSFTSVPAMYNQDLKGFHGSTSEVGEQLALAVRTCMQTDVFLGP